MAEQQSHQRLEALLVSGCVHAHMCAALPASTHPSASWERRPADITCGVTLLMVLNELVNAKLHCQGSPTVYKHALLQEMHCSGRHAAHANQAA